MRLTHINKYKFGLGENERYEENISITFTYDIIKKTILNTLLKVLASQEKLVILDVTMCIEKKEE